MMIIQPPSPSRFTNMCFHTVYQCFFCVCVCGGGGEGVRMFWIFRSIGVSWPPGVIKRFMLNSTEHENSTAHKN